MRTRRYRFLLIFVFLAVSGDTLVSHTAVACPVGTKILIDNGQSGYSETGNDWATWPSNNQAIGKDYRYLSHTVGGSDRKGTAKWVPSLPTAGIYKISAIFRATVNRSYDADYFVTDSAGKSHHVVVDQRDGAKSEADSHGPVYKSLGSHHLAPGKGHVLLDGTDDNLSDEADAVQFELVSCGTGPPPPPPGPCQPIAQNPAFEVCVETASTCAGVYTNGAGCKAYCGAAGMVCVKRYGGGPGCQKEPQNPIGCNAVNNHLSDWCECAFGPTPKLDAGTTTDGMPPGDLGQPFPDQGVQPSPDTNATSTDGSIPQPTHPGGPGSSGCECTTGGDGAPGPVLALILLLGLWCHRHRRSSMKMVMVLLCGALLCCNDPDPGSQVSGDGGSDAVAPRNDGRPELGLHPEAGIDAGPTDGIPTQPDIGLDAGPDPDGPAPDAGPPVFSHKAVATTTDPGFFSLRTFNGQLLAGTYGSGKIYSSSNSWAAPLVDLNVGESVYVMWPFSSMLYANTENRGEIWRTPGGKTWKKVFNGASTAIGTGLAVYNGQLYAAYTTLSNMAGRIYRSATGDPGTWKHVFGSSSQGTDVTLRELVVYKNVLYCLSYDWDGSIGGFYTTTNGTVWKWHPKLANHRPIKAHVWNGYLWISTSPYKGKRVPPASVYRWDGTSLVNVFQDKARAVGADLLDFNGALYFVDLVNWRATQGAAALHRSPTGAAGTWQTVLTFPEPEAMDMEVFGGNLYVTTRHEGGHGKVYRVEIQ